MASTLELANRYATAVGGFAPPAHPLPYHNAKVIQQAFLDFELKPMMTHVFRSSAEVWAISREQELRDEHAAREVERELAAAEWPFE